MLFGLQVFLDVQVSDPRFQIAGMCIVIDFLDMRKENLLKILDTKAAKMMIKYHQARHFITTSSYFIIVESSLLYCLLGMFSCPNPTDDVSPYPKGL